MDITVDPTFEGKFPNGIPDGFEADKYWWRVNISFIVISLFFIGYFLAIDIIQLVTCGLDRLKVFWVWLNFFSYGLNIAFIVCDLIEVNAITIRPIGSIAVFLMYFKVFFFLRLFSSTSSMIRLIVEIIKDMGSFTMVLMLAILAWGHTFYILSINTY
jgi:hypothetical protein